MSILVEVFTYGLIYSLASIMIIGLAWLCVLKRYDILDADNAASMLLSACALGFYWNAVVFALFYILKIPLEGAWKIKLCCDSTIFVLAACAGRVEAYRFCLMVIKNYLSFLLVGGAILGTWAFFVFPNALDSGQVKAVQTLVLGGATRKISMFGYSGLALFATQFVGDYPVATVAGSFKPLLAMIAVCTAYYAVVALNLPHRNLNATILLALIVLSTFGTFGIVERGKDSIFGVLFSLAFILTLCRLDASRRGPELSLYFAAAAATGIIAVPYMLIAYVLWLLPAQNNSKGLATLKYLYIVNLPIIPLGTAGFAEANYFLLFGGYIALGVIGFVASLLIARYKVASRLTRFRFQESYLYILLGLILICFVLMPVRLELGLEGCPDGSTRVMVHQPLDGKTTFLDYFLQLKIQVVTIAVGMVAGIVLMVTQFGKGRPGLFALTTMLFALLACVLIRIHFRIPIIPNFHIWDLAKDARMWYGGLAFSVLALAGINWLVWTVVPRRTQVLALIAIAVLMIAWPIQQLPLKRYMKLATATSIGGFQEQANAVVLEVLWKNFKGAPVYLSLAGKGSGRRALGDLKMFGPSVVDWYTSSVEPQFDLCCTKIGLIIGKNEVKAIEDLASAKGATIKHIATVDNGETKILLVAMKTSP